MDPCGTPQGTIMIDSIKNFLKVDHDHASIISFVYVKSDLVCQVC